MKGTVVVCLNSLVREKFGEDKWHAILEDAGLGKRYSVFISDDVDDQVVFKLIGSTCKVLKITQAQAFDAFGEYWMCEYGPKVYLHYYSGMVSSRDFIVKLDKLHVQVTKSIKNAKPPRFIYDWKTKDTLVLTYQSTRGLIDLMISMTKGVGAYFKETLLVTKVSANQLQITFPPEASERKPIPPPTAAKTTGARSDARSG